MNLISYIFKKNKKKVSNNEDDELIKLLNMAIKHTERYNSEYRKKPGTFTRESAIKIIKGDFENYYGISLERFIKEYKDIMSTCPEKLI